MKQLSLINGLIATFILASCKSNEEPDFPVFMQPSSIQTTSINGNNQTFEYDDYGRIVSWKCQSKTSQDPASYTAHYSYPDENTIKVISEEVLHNERRNFEETIQLKNGRAIKSEGTFAGLLNGSSQLNKIYRLEYNYLASNHLNSVKHSEVMAAGDNIKDDVWDNAWTWENFLIWEDGNLREFQDYQGNSTPFHTTKYEYSIYAVAYPIVIPMVINNAHHMPLCMQGVFGLNSVNLVK